MKASKYVQNKGDWIVIYNKSTKEHALVVGQSVMMNWDQLEKGTICINKFISK